VRQSPVRSHRAAATPHSADFAPSLSLVSWNQLLRITSASSYLYSPALPCPISLLLTSYDPFVSSTPPRTVQLRATHSLADQTPAAFHIATESAHPKPDSRYPRPQTTAPTLSARNISGSSFPATLQAPRLPSPVQTFSSDSSRLHRATRSWPEQAYPIFSPVQQLHPGGATLPSRIRAPVALSTPATFPTHTSRGHPSLEDQIQAGPATTTVRASLEAVGRHRRSGACCTDLIRRGRGLF